MWVDEEFLLAQEVQPWMGLPLWVPTSDPEAAGFMGFDVSKAQRAGLAYRPLAETVRDTLAWAHGRGDDYTWRAGISRAKERELLLAWAKQTQT